MMRFTLRLCLAALVAVQCLAAKDGIINKEVTRVIDATSAIVKLTAEIKASGMKGEYVLTFPTQEAKCISYIAVSIKGKAQTVSAPVSRGNTTAYTVSVSDSSATLKVTAVLTSFLEPFPAEITQAEQQLVRLHETHALLSPYPTETQKTSIRLASRTVESYSKRSPQSLAGSVLTYGPYTDVPANTLLPATVHFVNNKPFAKFSTMAREVEVSHWGQVSVEETYELKHAGATLKGGFSRLDYSNRGGRGDASPSFRSVVAALPLQAHSIYYRDQIGNISTSDLRVAGGAIQLDVQTRFPMFGGWQTQFYIGYSLPTEALLFVDPANPTRHSLRIDFFTIFQDVWAEEMEVKVVLPEGVRDVKVEVPYPVEEAWTTRFTYLDSVFNGGRPVLTLKARNVVEEHDKKITISYTFDRPRMLFEPLVLCATFFAFFVFCSLLSRVGSVSASSASSSSSSGSGKEGAVPAKAAAKAGGAGAGAGAGEDPASTAKALASEYAKARSEAQQ